ncbi:MAG: ribonuclease P protein component [Bacteroidales bacterium]|jgi:ribonuclease P protein component|nr:ribonuclease P protein component [Bacteroidales bacterium]
MFHFKKIERLCGYSIVNDLFAKGESFLIYPLSVHYNITKDYQPKVRILIVCPKRYQKLSVNRNKIKRLLRESYRLNKNQLIDFSKSNNLSIDFSISYVSNQMMDYHLIEMKLKDVLVELEKRSNNQ